MDKLNLFTLAFAFYATNFPADKERLAKLKVAIDKETDFLVKDVKIETAKPEPVKQENKPEQKPVEQNKSNQPVGKSQKEIDDLKKAKADAAKAEADAKFAADKAKAEKDVEQAKIAEVLVELVPFYACEVKAKDAKYSKAVKIHAPRGFKCWEDEDAAKTAKLDTLYPNITVLELVLDEAWDMACKGVPNSEIKDMCKKELKGFYPELKADSDWYSKLANPIVGMVGFIKKAFGYKVDDKTVTVTRPTEKGLVLEFESDCFVAKPTEKAETKPAGEKELKTTQTASTNKNEKKPDVKADKRVDEEAQEKEETTESEEDNTPSLEFEDETPERDTEEAPVINAFDDFNEFETLVFEKLLEGAKLAKDAKDEATKKAIQAENREEVRNLIASNYDGEPWTIKTDDGKWNPKLINYQTAIINEIAKNREKWAKK